MRPHVTACGYLERFFTWLSDWAQTMAWRFAVCPDCGRNRYSGRPCKNLEVRP